MLYGKIYIKEHEHAPFFVYGEKMKPKYVKIAAIIQSIILAILIGVVWFAFSAMDEAPQGLDGVGIVLGYAMIANTAIYAILMDIVIFIGICWSCKKTRVLALLMCIILGFISGIVFGVAAINTDFYEYTTINIEQWMLMAASFGFCGLCGWKIVRLIKEKKNEDSNDE